MYQQGLPVLLMDMVRYLILWKLFHQIPICIICEGSDEIADHAF